MVFKKIKLPFQVKKPILALGSHTKNTVCFIKGNLAVLSPVHPDLNNPEDFLNFIETAKYFLKKNPKTIAYDLHPEYQSTKYAHQLSAMSYELLAIQHHHAHIASCMAENGLRNQRVIGVAFDGTGLGSDSVLWGAEFLLCDYKNFQRKAKLREVPLLGQERAIQEPWRTASAWLYSVYKDRFLNLGIDFVRGIDKNKWRILKNMYLTGFNSPLVSSMGRLFDAVASLVLERHKADFEAELAVAIEKLAMSYELRAMSYNFKIIKNKAEYIVDPTAMFKQIVSDLKAKEPREKIAYRFHLTVAEMVRKISLVLRSKTKINKVILSGGVFQNKLLLSLSLDLLCKEGFKVFTHRGLSSNDTNISLGQAVVANFSYPGS